MQAESVSEFPDAGAHHYRSYDRNLCVYGKCQNTGSIYRSRCIPVHCNADSENGNGE